jgi:ParB family chromosome partitioning protein
LTHIPAVVRQVDDGTALAVALVENIQRAELNPLEEAQAMEKLRGLCGMTHEAIATAVGRSRAAVTNLLRLLELEEPVQALLLAGALEMGHARALLALAGPAQVQAAQEVVRGQLTVRRTEELVRRALQGVDDKLADSQPHAMSVFMQQAQSSLSVHLGLPVVIQPRRDGGQVVIRFQDRQQLEGLLRGLLEEDKPQLE